MPVSNASFISARPYRSADDLAVELSALFAGGVSLDAFDTDSIDGRYARLAAVNVFTADQRIVGGKLRIESVTSGNALQIAHAVTSGGEASAAVLVQSTNAAGCVAIKRDVTSGAGDHLVTITENISAFNGLRIAYGGSASALYVAQTGSGTYAIETAGKGIYVAAGGIVVNAGGLNVTGGATITTGGLTVSAGASSFAAAVTITSGGLNVSAGGGSVTGGLTVTNTGLTVSAGGSNITGNSTFNSQLTVSGQLNANGGVVVSGNITGVTATTTGSLTVTGASITVNSKAYSARTIQYLEHDGVTKSSVVALCQ